MKFKFVVTCKHCGCRSELTSGEWEDYNRFQCQNCRVTMDSDQFGSIRDAAYAISVAMDNSELFSVEIGNGSSSPFDR